MVADLSWVSAGWLAAPKDEDVVAGPIGFVIFVALCIAVAFLGWSLNKHLKKAGRAADEGVYDDPGAATPSSTTTATPTSTTSSTTTATPTSTTSSTPTATNADEPSDS